MAVRAGTVYVDVLGDFTELEQGLDNATSGAKSKFKNFGRAAAGGLAVAGGAFAVFAKTGLESASDVSESLSKNETLFGKHSKAVEKFSDTSAKSYGISKKAALEYTGVFGNLFRSLGESEGAAAKQSVALTTLAADMASFNNTSVEEALEAIRSGLVGETEPLRKFGVNMNDATLRAQALKMGLIDSTKDALDPHTKALASAALITAQTSAAHGDFEKTSGGLANQQKILKARVEDAATSLGMKLLPFALKVVSGLNDLVTSAQNGTGIFGTLRGVFDRAAPVIEQVAGFIAQTWEAMRSSSGEGGILAGVIDTLKSAFDNVVDAARGVYDVAGALWRQFGDDVIKTVQNALDVIAPTVKAISDVVKGVIDFVAGVLTGDWSRAWDGIKGIVRGAWDGIKTLVDAALDQLVILIGAAWGVIKTAARDAWNDIKDRILSAVRGARDALGDVLTGITNRLGDAWTAARDGVRDAFDYVRDKILGALRTARDTVGEVLTGIDNRLDTAWGTVRSGVRDAFDYVRDKILGALREARDTVGEVVTGISNRVTSGFDKITDAAKNLAEDVGTKLSNGFKTGANAAIGFINGIIKAINAIPGVPNIGLIEKFATGGKIDKRSIPGFARGGAIHHDAFAKGGEITRPMVVVGEEAPRHPEYVIPTNPAYRDRALGLHAQLSRQLGVPGFAIGGVYSDGFTGGGLPSVGDIASAPLKLLEQGAKFILDKLPGTGDLPSWLKGTGNYVLKEVTKWIKDKVGGIVPDLPGGNGSGGGVGSLNQAMSLARSMGLQITSTTGGKHAPGSYHYSGRAFDASNGFGPTPEMMAFAKTMIRRSRAKLLELFYSPLGYSIKNGGVTAPIAAAGHYNHVHVAMAKGGILGGGKTMTGPFVGSYKTGGIVPRDGLAYVHQGETITPAGEGVDVHVHVNDPALRDLIRVEIVDRERGRAGIYRAGVRR